jgi:hypothetical protein
VEGAAGAAAETGAVEENAGAVHDAGIGAGLVAEDTAFGRLGTMFEEIRAKSGRQRRDHPGFIDVA